MALNLLCGDAVVSPAPNFPLMNSRSNSESNATILQVAVPSPLRRTFDYLQPKVAGGAQVEPGLRVAVPFGKRRLVGIITAVKNQSDVATSRLKPVYEYLDMQPLFPATLFKTLHWCAQYYHHPIGEVFATALPARLRMGGSLHEVETHWSTEKISAEEQSGLRRARRQFALYEFINADGPVTATQCRDAGYSTALIKELETKKFIRSKNCEEPALTPFQPANPDNFQGLPLNAEQCSAVETIKGKLGEFACSLLDGVTGSGKTEVYMQLMREVLGQGRQCLILVPEIGLTPQTVERFKSRFEVPLAVLHSGLTEAARMDAWRAAAFGTAGIVIGTRSAVFTPLHNPGLIIVDEEHDSSFKQQEGLRYSARDLAIYRAQQENINVVLGSATPSLESLRNARAKRFAHLRLMQPAGTAVPSPREVIDIDNSAANSGFTDLLLHKISKHLDAGNQVLVFINRRGYAPVLSCQDCGWISECEQCIAQMTVHSMPAGLRCHHCGRSRSLPRHCPACSSSHLQTLGLGTQKVEKFLAARFGNTPVVRIDRDSTRRRNSLQQLLEQVHAGEPCILLGTQMLAKGHHFPQVTLVAIVNADSGLFSADFRGQEVMSQTIVQVAGRAGRAERPGEVVIQSQHSAHPHVQALVTGSYADIAEQLLDERAAANMPPFSYLCLIRSEARSMAEALGFLEKVAAEAKQIQPLASKVELLGPMPSPMEKRGGRYRGQLLIKAGNRNELQQLLGPLSMAIEAMKQPAMLRWHLDVDPLDLI